MSDHVVHACTNVPPGHAASLLRNYGWNRAEIPLNKKNHKNCPYCGADVSTMQTAGADAVLLSVHRRGRNFITGGGRLTVGQGQTAGLEELIVNMGKQIEDLRKQIQNQNAGTTTGGTTTTTDGGGSQ